MVQSGVDLAVGGVDRVEVTRWCVGVRLTNQAGKRPEETHPKLDQQHAKFQSERSQAVAAGLTDALDEAFRAQFAEVIAKLAESVVVGGEAMASDDACVQLTGGPVADEATGMQQRLEETNHPVVMQLEARYAALSDQRWSRQCGELASIDRTGQQLGLFGEAPLIGGGQPFAEQR